jgi:filamentous hemagglutinin family protein
MQRFRFLQLALAGLLFAAPVCAAAQAQSVTGQVSVAGRSVPLPPGEWRQIGAASDQQTLERGNMVVGSAILVQETAGRLAAMVIISEASTNPARPINWAIPNICSRDNTFARFAATAVAQAQAPNAVPTGGQVSAGQATISQSGTRTQVTQGSNRAVVDWQRFDVGRNSSVNFTQPSAQSWTLNRVTTPDPSRIAGQITANGGVAIVNQSGVVFAQGSQVNVGSLIASTANITNQNFMAGRMEFNERGREGARVVCAADCCYIACHSFIPLLQSLSSSILLTCTL